MLGRVCRLLFGEQPSRPPHADGYDLLDPAVFISPLEDGNCPYGRPRSSTYLEWQTDKAKSPPTD